MNELKEGFQNKFPINRITPGPEPWTGEMEMDCNWDCLTNCPVAAWPQGTPRRGALGDCLKEDPDIPDKESYIHYPVHELWRDDHEDQVHPEPKDPYRTRCPRCYSVEVKQDDRYIWCESCHFNETLDQVDY